MLSIIVLTYNSAKDLRELLPSLDWASEIVVVDDNSSDNSVSIAKSCGARVYKRKLNDDFSAQRNFSLTKITNNWILFIDPDERVTKELKEEILETILKNDSDYDGYKIKRQDVFWGRRLRFGEVGKCSLVRLGRKGKGKWERSVHEIWKIDKCRKLKNTLMHYAHDSIESFLDDINKYTNIDSKYRFNRGERVGVMAIILYPVGKFLLNYFFRMGFLDGIEGLVMAYMMSLHSIITRIKLYQLNRKI